MRNVLLILVLAIGLVGCIEADRENRQKARQAISAKLTDPSSAVFSDFTVRTTVPGAWAGHTIMRVKVNAKNQFGGYTGVKEWVIIFNLNDSVTDAEIKEDLHLRLAQEFLENIGELKTHIRTAKQSSAFIPLISALQSAGKLALMGYTEYIKEAKELEKMYYRSREKG